MKTSTSSRPDTTETENNPTQEHKKVLATGTAFGGVYENTANKVASKEASEEQRNGETLHLASFTQG